MDARALVLLMLITMGSAGAADSLQVAPETVAIAHLMALHDHEIKAADIAATKQLSAPVAQYAAMLKREHTENQAQTASLPTAPAAADKDTSAVAARKEKTAAERQALSAMSGEEFEAAYLDAMVKDHADALQMLDANLMPAATTPAVRSHLQQTREHLAMHLERAEALQAK